MDEQYQIKITSFKNAIMLRQHQVEALHVVLKAVNEGKTRLLLAMAQGSGKTILSVEITRRLLISKKSNRILILTNLSMIEQQLLLFQENLSEFITVKFENNMSSDYAQVVISTMQRFSRNKDNFNSLFNFDTIIFNDLNEVPEISLNRIDSNFEGLQIGFINDPRYLNINQQIENYRKNNMSGFEIVFEYSILDAVQDGYITNPYKENKKLEINHEFFNKLRTKMKELNNSVQFFPNNKNSYALDEILMLIENANKQVIENNTLFEDYRSSLTKDDIISLKYKKDQLKLFESMLEREVSEVDWQAFFEENKWIFGYGLNYIFTSSLNDKKLEQVVAGYNFNQNGKRVDALMKTKGLVSSLCFVEIKKSNTRLLKDEYRKSCWSVSDELSGALAQIQKTVQKALKDLSTKTELLSNSGDPTGEEVFLYAPKSYIIVGLLSEFRTNIGVNEEKYSSFELFRKNLIGTEIITYDELFQRAKYILEVIEKY